MLSRAKPAIETPESQATAEKAVKSNKKSLKLETFVANRDYIGAITVLEVGI